MKKLAIVAVLIAVIVFGIVAYASALTANQTVTVNVTSKPLLTMTVSTDAVDFGPVNPGEVQTQQAVTVTVASNKQYSLTKLVSGQYALMGLGTSMGTHPDPDLDKTAGTPAVDTYSLTMPWATDPGDYTATVVYTATQK